MMRFVSVFVLIAGISVSSYATANSDLQEARKTFEAGKYVPAAAGFSRIVSTYPSSPEAAVAAYYIGLSNERQGHRQEALNAYRAMLERYGNSEMARFARQRAREVEQDITRNPSGQRSAPPAESPKERMAPAGNVENLAGNVVEDIFDGGTYSPSSQPRAPALAPSPRAARTRPAPTTTVTLARASQPRFPAQVPSAEGSWPISEGVRRANANFPSEEAHGALVGVSSGVPTVNFPGRSAASERQAVSVTAVMGGQRVTRDEGWYAVAGTAEISVGAGESAFSLAPARSRSAEEFPAESRTARSGDFDLGSSFPAPQQELPGDRSKFEPAVPVEPAPPAFPVQESLEGPSAPVGRPAMSIDKSLAARTAPRPLDLFGSEQPFAFRKPSKKTEEKDGMVSALPDYRLIDVPEEPSPILSGEPRRRGAMKNGFNIPEQDIPISEVKDSSIIQDVGSATRPAIEEVKEIEVVEEVQAGLEFMEDEEGRIRLNTSLNWGPVNVASSKGHASRPTTDQMDFRPMMTPIRNPTAPGSLNLPLVPVSPSSFEPTRFTPSTAPATRASALAVSQGITYEPVSPGSARRQPPSESTGNVAVPKNLISVDKVRAELEKARRGLGERPSAPSTNASEQRTQQPAQSPTQSPTQPLAAQSPADRHIMAAMGYRKTGMVEKAIEEYKTALEMDPNNPVAMNNLADIYLNRNERVDEAVSLLEGALGQNPSPRGPYLATLGWAYAKQGDLVRAERVLSESLESEVTAERLMHLGIVYSAQGLAAKARATLNRALAFAENPGLADRIRNELRRIERGELGQAQAL